MSKIIFSKQLVLTSNKKVSFVAVGGAGKTAYSTNGTKWFASVMPHNGNWYSATYGGGKFVAVAYNSNIGAYSTDGINWLPMSLPYSAKWISVKYGGGLFVAIEGGYGNKAAYSTDGINWQASTLPVSAFWTSLVYGGGKFIAVTSNTNNVFVQTTNGASWTTGTLPKSANWYVGYCKDKFFAVAGMSLPDSGIVCSSQNLLNWSSSCLPKEDTTINWRGIAYGNDTLVVIAYGSRTIAYSTDEVNWNTSLFPVSSNYWNSITFAYGKFVATGINMDKSGYSTNGINWKLIPMPSYGNWMSVTSRND